MKTESLRIGMKVRHPQYGIGVVRNIGMQTAEVAFSDLPRTVAPELSGLEPAEPQAVISGLEIPLAQLLAQVAQEAAQQALLAHDKGVAEELGLRWNGGKVVLHPSDPTLQTKEVSLEAFFHKIVMMRNNLRTLEQKINAHDKLNDAEKFDMQQYITRCYGSMTTFNTLFKTKAGQFSGTGS